MVQKSFMGYLNNLARAVAYRWEHGGRSRVEQLGRSAGRAIYSGLVWLWAYLTVAWYYLCDYVLFREVLCIGEVGVGSRGRPQGMRRNAPARWRWYEVYYGGTGYGEVWTAGALWAGMAAGIWAGAAAYGLPEKVSLLAPWAQPWFWAVFVLVILLYPGLHRWAKLNTLQSLAGGAIVTFLYGFPAPLISLLISRFVV